MVLVANLYARRGRGVRNTATAVAERDRRPGTPDGVPGLGVVSGSHRRRTGAAQGRDSAGVDRGGDPELGEPRAHLDPAPRLRARLRDRRRADGVAAVLRPRRDATGRGTPSRPRWERPALLALLAGTAVLYLWDLSASGYANDFYAAAVQAGTQSWKAWLFGSLDSGNAITVDKPPAVAVGDGASARGSSASPRGACWSRRP